LLVIGYGAKICWVAMRVKAENRMVTNNKTLGQVEPIHYIKGLLHLYDYL